MKYISILILSFLITSCNHEPEFIHNKLYNEFYKVCPKCIIDYDEQVKTLDLHNNYVATHIICGKVDSSSQSFCVKYEKYENNGSYDKYYIITVDKTPKHFTNEIKIKE